jgi:predicted lysophospholipase L1 biosynthesis ABC-type transport system permease subunit
MAERFWPGQDAVGQDIVVFEDQPFAASRRIIGIVGDVRANAVAEVAAPTVFLPFAQHPGRGLALLLRGTVPPERLQAAVIQRLRAFDTQISVSSVLPLQDVVAAAVARPRFSLVLAGSFALLALGLAAIGTFGLVAYHAARRTQEIGIRMALGAARADVLRLVVGQAFRLTAIGLGLGLAGAYAVTRLMASLLFGVGTSDPPTFVGVTVILAASAMFAAWVPADRATRVDPMVALRAE